MKKYLLIIAAVISVHTAHAQFFQLGLKGGISSSKTQVNEAFSINNATINYTTGDAVLGWHIGLYSRIKISGFFIQPEVLFSSTGGHIEITGEDINIPAIGEIDLNKLDVPVMFGFYLGNSFRIFAGPTFSYLISEDINGLELYPDVKQNYHDATIGYQAGLGIDVSRVTLELKYEGSLSALGESVTLPFINETFSTDMRNPQFIASIGLRLF
ncbi:MAG: PorT family protein [Cyclobacteriaceae bacterium]|nr:PorT family protein [Cyclobacteriaceae bacterium]